MTPSPNPVADERYDATVRPAVIELVEAVSDVEEPLERLAVIARLEERLTPLLAALKTFAVREARDAGESLATIGEELGVSAQRVHQLARLNDQEHPTP